MLSDGSDLIRELEIPGYGDDEVEFMEDAVLLCKPSFVGDWGTNIGGSARIWYELCRLHDFAPLIVTVDLPLAISSLDRDHAGARTGILIRSCYQVSQRHGDGVTVALEGFIRTGRPRRALFFVDGDHEYHNVYRELTYIHRVAPSAIVLMHDTKLDPGQALKTFCSFNPGSYTVDWLESQAGMALLVPSG